MSVLKSCKRCLYNTDHPLGLIIDSDGICSGCRIHEEKDSLDWNQRWDDLTKLVSEYRTTDTKSYDCIVPVSGSMDAYYILHIVKEKLGLNPLLVTYNKYWNTPLGIKNLANLRIKFNCDILVQNVNPNAVKNIVKSTLRSKGSVYWHCIAGQTVFPVQTAIRYKIPLIIWGAHQGTEQVGMFSHEHDVEMTRRYRKDHDLMGLEADDLLSTFDTLREEDIWQYRYPEDKELNSVGVRGIYLSNFVRWDPKAQHELVIEKYGYKSARFNRTFDCYDFVDCFNYMNIHDELKLYKHGYSKVTDHATREIRHGRLTRNQGENLVLQYQQKKPEHYDLMCKWLNVDKRSLQFVMDMHRNPKYWKKQEDGQWVLLARSNNLSNNESYSIPFIENSTLTDGKSCEYITIGKGWP